MRARVVLLHETLPSTDATGGSGRPENTGSRCGAIANAGSVRLERSLRENELREVSTTARGPGIPREERSEGKRNQRQQKKSLLQQVVRVHDTETRGAEFSLGFVLRKPVSIQRFQWVSGVRTWAERRCASSPKHLLQQVRKRNLCVRPFGRIPLTL
jgi:hypothetical protein